jgi:DNA-directed RNA polymerase subunit RPC12/RpoP
MAMCTDYTCGRCGFRVESWDDGNPYLMNAAGKRHHYYHPGGPSDIMRLYQELTGAPEDWSALETYSHTHGGIEGDYLCQHCGRQTRRDPARDVLRCTGCKRMALLPCEDLEGKPCPKCRQGVFTGQFGAIS